MYANATAAAMAPDYRASAPRLYAYLAIAIVGGQVLVPLLLVSFLFTRGLRRHPTLLNFLVSWIVYSIAVCLLFYAGHGLDQIPPPSLCLAQVALINAAYFKIAFAAVALMLHLFLTLPTVNDFRGPSPIRETILVLLAPFVFGLYLIVFFAVNSAAPQYVLVERGRLTCRFQSTPTTSFFSKFTPAIICIAMLSCLIMSMWMFKKTVKHVLNWRDWRLRSNLNGPRGPWFRILLRFTVFCVYAVLTEIASLIDVFAPQGPSHDIVDMYVATLPLAAFFIFGTLPDIRRFIPCLSAPKMDDSTPSAHETRFDLISHPMPPGRLSVNAPPKLPPKDLHISVNGTVTFVGSASIASPERVADPFGRRWDYSDPTHSR